MSEIKVNSVVNSTGDNDSGLDLATNDQVKVKIANAEDFIFKANSLEVQTGSNIDMNGTELILDADGDTSIEASTDDTIVIDTAGSERVRIDASGNFLVGKTSQDQTVVGAEIRSNGITAFTADATSPFRVNRKTDDGTLFTLLKDNTVKGRIGINNNAPFIVNVNHGGINFATSGSQARPVPCDETGAFEDDIHDFGDPSVRWDNIYASNGTIQTSDQNEKQDIANATAKELNVAKKLSSLFKTFRWKSKVAKKDDKARIHSGIIAQDIQSAFSAEGLDASNYGLFCLDTWTNEEGEEQTRLGVRYPELFSFIFSSIEARLTALESK
jgi:hypothetical protein